MKRLILGVVLALAVPFGHAQGFPEKPVRLIVPFPPGGGTDALGRILAAKLAELWGQQVVVENRAGAQGNIGTAAGAKAAADGYTLTFAHQGALVINPHIYKDTGYDTLKDFAPVALATEMAFVAVAHPSVPAADLRELAQYAKKNPGKLSFASTSAGPHIVGELFKQATGTDLLHVPYKGAGPAISDLLGGQVEASFQNINSVVQHIKAGKLRALAVTGDKRSTLLPDVPTLAEAGVKGADVYSWQAVAAPRGLPADVKGKLHAALVAALNDPAVKPKLVEVGFEVVANTPEQFAAFQNAEFARWKKVIETGKITAD
jgi:tripartite-type tricarboxylate transporter receptor subunit TctC